MQNFTKKAEIFAIFREIVAYFFSGKFDFYEKNPKYRVKFSKYERKFSKILRKFSFAEKRL